MVESRTAPAEGAIVTTGLVKRYGDLTALDGLDLNVPEGTVLGLFGPNGAGKTTAVRILTTLLPADGGSAWVAGIDVAAHPDEVRRRIGLSGQYAAVDEYLTGTENLEMIGRLYHMGKAPSRVRAVELIERFDLDEAADRPVKTYSGGMRRRLDLAGALVAKPSVLFLDEPTTGFDPAGRADMWDVIRELVGQGTTLLLTTQYMEEADLLADEIVVIDHGLCIERGTADELKQRAGCGADRAGGEPGRPDPGGDQRILAGYSLNGVQVDERSRQADGAGAGWRRHAAPGPGRPRRSRHRALRRRPASAHPRRRVPQPHRAHRRVELGTARSRTPRAAHEHEEVLR